MGASVFRFSRLLWNRCSSVIVAAIVCALSGAASSASQNLFLNCVLKSQSGEYRRYALHVEIPFFGPTSVTWVGINPHDLKVVRFDDTMIIANVDVRLAGWPDKADQMEFRLNRLTGQAEVSFLQKPSAKDGFPGLWVMTDFTETGSCEKSERAF